MFYAIELQIGVLSHIYGILFIQKHDIVSSEDKTGVPLCLLNFCYKTFTEKHVSYIVIPNIIHFDEFDLVASRNFLDVPQFYGPVRSHFLKVIRQETKALHEIISTSTTNRV